MEPKKEHVVVSSGSRIVRNTVFSSLSELSLILNFLFFMMAPKYLGGADYGKLASALAFVGLFTLFVVFGFSYSITKFIVKNRSQTGRYVGNALYLQFGLALVCFLLCQGTAWLLRWKYPPQVQLVIAIVYAAEALKCFNLTLRASCKALGEFYIDTIAVNAERILLVVLGGYLLIGGKGLITVAAVLPISRLVSFLILIRFMGRLGHPVFSRPDPALCRELARRSFVYVVQSAIWRVYDNIDVFLLSLFRSFEEVGWYSLARRILEGLCLVPNILTEAVYPELTSRHLVSRNLVATLFSKSLKYMLAVAFVVAFGTVVISSDFIRSLFGESFRNTSGVLVLLGIAVVPSFVRYLFGTTLIAVNLQKMEILVAAGRSGFNAAANLIAIPLWGFMGAGVAVLFTEWIFLVPYLVILARQRLIVKGHWKFAAKPFLAVAMLVPPILALSSVDSFFVLGGAIVLYALLLFGFRIFSEEEIKVFKEYLMRRLKIARPS